ncbi:NUDIX domain-containing protein [Peptoniphilus sp. AGMB00490]|uniref:NUDIX domain-containing protein n=2 Tax=Peptoniphilus TaxID=162289 RepID=A0ACD6AZB0_9FIRM|nr:MULTISPECIES: NUDIX domain-containing protein [Peptoniphilus]NMW85971.1 NUDIX domain-containing protein [Peptoniphilus faecalis]OLR64810.1 NUDIX hydrolase [Peptoniphilus porci]
MEYWDVYNKKGKWKRRAIRKGERLKNNEYHIIVEGWILRDDGNFIIQRRALEKKSFSGMWYCSAGGSVISGETPKEGMVREFKEELGIDIDVDELRLKRIIIDKNTIFYIFLVHKNISLDDITLQAEEVMDVDIADPIKIKKMVEDKTFIGLDYYEKFFGGIFK